MAAAIVWIIVVSQNALIASAAAAGQKKDHVTFLAGFWVSSSLFRPVFLVNVLAYAVVYVPLIVLGAIPAWLYLHSGSTTALFFASVVAFVFLIPINIIVSFLTKFATAYIIVKNYKLKQATNALALFAKNWLVSLKLRLSSTRRDVCGRERARGAGTAVLRFARAHCFFVFMAFIGAWC